MVALLRFVVPPQSGPLPHPPGRLSVYALEGTRGLEAPAFLAGAGSFVFLPRGVLHGFKNVGAQPAIMLLRPSPGVEKFFEEVGQPARGGIRRPRCREIKRSSPRPRSTARKCFPPPWIEDSRGAYPGRCRRCPGRTKYRLSEHPVGLGRYRGRPRRTRAGRRVPALPGARPAGTIGAAPYWRRFCVLSPPAIPRLPLEDLPVVPKIREAVFSVARGLRLRAPLGLVGGLLFRRLRRWWRRGSFTYCAVVFTRGEAGLGASTPVRGNCWTAPA